MLDYGNRKNAADAKAKEIEYLEGELGTLAEKDPATIGWYWFYGMLAFIRQTGSGHSGRARDSIMQSRGDEKSLFAYQCVSRMQPIGACAWPSRIRGHYPVTVSVSRNTAWERLIFKVCVGNVQGLHQPVPQAVSQASAQFPSGKRVQCPPGQPALHLAPDHDRRLGKHSAP